MNFTPLYTKSRKLACASARRLMGEYGRCSHGSHSPLTNADVVMTIRKRDTSKCVVRTRSKAIKPRTSSNNNKGCLCISVKCDAETHNRRDSQPLRHKRSSKLFVAKHPNVSLKGSYFFFFCVVFEFGLHEWFTLRRLITKWKMLHFPGFLKSCISGNLERAETTVDKWTTGSIVNGLMLAVYQFKMAHRRVRPQQE